MYLTVEIKDIHLVIIPPEEDGIPFDIAKQAEKVLKAKRQELEAYFDNEIAKAKAEGKKKCPIINVNLTFCLVALLTLEHFINLFLRHSVRTSVLPVLAACCLSNAFGGLT